MKPVNLVNSLEKPVGMSVGSAGLADFAMFVMDGFVSLPGDGRKVPVKILCDTAASQSFILVEELRGQGSGPICCQVM